MPQAELTLTLPEDVWIGRLSRSHPAVTFRILSAFAAEETGVGLVEIIGPSLDDVIRELQANESIVDLDLLQLEPSRALVQFETTFPLLLLPVQDSGVPLEMPFAIEDGRALWALTAPQDRLSELGAQLDAFDIEFDVESVRQQIVSTDLLTDRQRHLVKAAVDHGYYDTPRTCSLTELAEDIGLAKSTCSETLHRAEEQIIKQFIASEETQQFADPPSAAP